MKYLPAHPPQRRNSKPKPRPCRELSPPWEMPLYAFVELLDAKGSRLDVVPNPRWVIRRILQDQP